MLTHIILGLAEKPSLEKKLFLKRSVLQRDVIGLTQIMAVHLVATQRDV